MKKKIISKKFSSVLLLSLTLLLAAIMAFSFCFGAIKSVTTFIKAESLMTSAKAMCLMEATTGRVLAFKNADARLAMASTTKIATAITAIENAHDLDEVFEVSPKAVGISGTSLYLRKGEKHSLRDLLYGLMLVSGNDASFAIGERVGGSVEHFVDKMNFLAHRLGAKNTHFENTHGLDEEGHYTSAKDLATITSYALNNDTFREIVSTQNKKITSLDGKDRYLCNKNKLLRTYDGAIGVKTGFTDDAGRCLVSAAERDGMRLVCVVLCCGPMFEESAALLDWGFKNFQMTELTSLVNIPESLPINCGEKDAALIGKAETRYLYPLKNGELDNLEIKLSHVESLTPPSKSGEKVGEYQILLNNDLLFSGKIVTMEPVKERSLLQRVFDIVDLW